MNAIEILIREHNTVKSMLDEINNEHHCFEKKINLFNKLSDDLIRHETMEHKVWYPHFKNDSRLGGEVKHLLKEENDAEKAIKKLSHIDNEKEWQELFIKFQNDVVHHAREEEEKLFPQVKKILDESDLKIIGKQMREFKEAYKD